MATQEALVDAKDSELVPPRRVAVTQALVDQHLNATADDTFPLFAAGVLLSRGVRIAPPLVLAQELGTRMQRKPGSFALHAKQRFRFLRPLEVGHEYTLAGHVGERYEKRGATYLAIGSTAVDVQSGSAISVESTYVRAFGFANEQYKGSGTAHEPMTRKSWLESQGANRNAVFPDVGSVLEGPATVITQAHINISAGPASNIHTDRRFARSRGFASTIVQGLTATALECAFYREIFGLSFFHGSEIAASYTGTIPEGSRLAPLSVVASCHDDRIELWTAMFADDRVVSLSTVSVWGFAA